jgi:hypothetical protein
MANGKKCRYETCIRISTKSSDECAACRARYRYWEGKSPARRLERRRRLELSGETMREFVQDRALNAKIKKEFKKEKAYAARAST